MMEQSVAKKSDRILVALDASSQSVAALRAAAELAALLGVELEGIFIEDINLMHLCAFPFGREIGSYTAEVRQLDRRAMERQLRVLALDIRKAMERVAGQVPIHWTFEVRRGPVVAELLAASKSASMLSLGRAGHSQHRALGSTAQSILRQSLRPVLILGEDGALAYPLIVLYTGTEAAIRALHLAVRLARRNNSVLHVLVWSDEDKSTPGDTLRAQAEQILKDEKVEFWLTMLDSSADFLPAVRAGVEGTLVLPGESSFLLTEHSGPAILVP